MKQQLQREKLYAFIVAAMMCSVSVNAQIVYADIEPDSTFTFVYYGIHTYKLDLNGDSITDFLIKVSRPRPRYPESPTSSSVSIIPQENNAIMTTTLQTVKKLVQDDAISSSRAWHTTTSQNLKWYQIEGFFPPVITNTGEWDNVVNGYVGLQLIYGGQTYYGWVRMDVNVTASSASMTIKDYAYNSIPNQPILAGQTMTTGIFENHFASSINLYPNPAADHLTIDLGSTHNKVRLTISDLTGKVIYTTQATDIQAVEVNTEDFAEGIYIVQIQAADFMGTKKCIIQK